MILSNPPFINCTQKTVCRRSVMGDVPGKPSALFLALRRRHWLRGDEEQRVRTVSRLRIRNLRGTVTGQRGATEWASSTWWQVRLTSTDTQEPRNAGDGDKGKKGKFAIYHRWNWQNTHPTFTIQKVPSAY